MNDDKRLNEIIRVKRAPNNFVMMDKGFLENEKLSWKAKGILAYLLSKPDGWKSIVGNIVNNSTDGKTAVYNGLKELSEQGYYSKKPLRNEQGTRIVKWVSTVSEIPNNIENTPSSLLTDFQEIDNQDIGYQDVGNRERNNNYLSNIDSSNNYESENPPTSVQRHGESGRVHLTAAQHKELVTAYGAAKTTDYINRLDYHIESTGKAFKNHCRTIRKWIIEDDSKKQPTQPKPKSNKFVNFEQREYDFDALEQQLLNV